MSAVGRLYLDHAATTPVLSEARAAVLSALEQWANPSSPHAEGRRVRAALEQARHQLADLLGWRHDVILTSGASEAIQMAATRAKVPQRIVGATEHEVVLASMGSGAAVLPVDDGGLVDPAQLTDLLRLGPALVAVQLVNNETGVVQPARAIAESVRREGSLLLLDCAQAAGKMDIPEADFIAVSGHKFGGPPGTGALLVKDLAQLQAVGGQERGYRRGTENGPAMAGMVAALAARAFRDAMPRLGKLREWLDGEIEASGGIVIARHSPRLPTIGAYAMPGVASASQLVQLDLAGIAVSAGSACSSGSLKPSRVLQAMEVPPEIAGSVIRVSFGPSTQQRDVERFISGWRAIASRAKVAAA